jgi:LmbE family N-acetylglucosaminyl deacetylase
MGPTVTSTLVALHAHPDDESLLTGGTLARAAAEGHRVVLVVATAGERGLAADSASLAARRTAELERAAALLGISRLVLLGYADSGFREPAEPPAGSFCTVPVAEAAERVAAVLTEEKADVLTVYDARGGYGHRDHVRVHDVGVAAAARAGTPIVLGATVDRAVLLRGVRLLRRLGVRPGGMTPELLAGAFTDAADVTHEVDVRAFVQVKQAALRAHASQASGGDDVRTVRLLSRLPGPLARLVLGREWFVELGAPAAGARVADPFVSARSVTVYG